jgi:hypothetical protein
LAASGLVVKGMALKRSLAGPVVGIAPLKLLLLLLLLLLLVSVAKLRQFEGHWLLLLLQLLLLMKDDACLGPA